MSRIQCSIRSVGFLVAFLLIVHRVNFAQTGSGLFVTVSTYDTGGLRARSVAVADVSGDSTPDLLLANHCDTSSCQNGAVGVLLGNGDGTFEPAVSYGSGGLYAESVAVADVNRDGKPDLLVANDNGIGVLYGNGDGTFRSAITYGPGGTSIVAADVNGDANLDLLVADFTQGLCVLLNNGDGTFQAAVAHASGGASALSVAVTDLNGDGKADLIVGNDCISFDNCASGGTVGVLLGNRDGTFQPVVSYGSGGTGAWSVAVADVNGDGKPDLLVANKCLDSMCTNASGTVGVLLGNGDGTFRSAVTYGSGGYEISWVTMAVADVNGDSKPDLLVTNECLDSNCANTNGTVGVLLGNGDGTFQSVMTYGSGGGRAWSVAAADVNGDGKPDLLVANEVLGVGVLLSAPAVGGGTISVTTNLSAGAFTITGPASFSGSGMSTMFKNAPVGSYTITFGPLPGYSTPVPQTQTLIVGGTLAFVATYSLSPPPQTGTINVTTNTSSAIYTLNGPTTFSGSGVSASFTNVPAGDYTITYGPACRPDLPASSAVTLAAGGTITFAGKYSPGFLTFFPLSGLNACTAKINAVFDHSQLRPYANDLKVVAYTGEMGLCDSSNPPQNFQSVVGVQHPHSGYRNRDGAAFRVNGNYSGGGTGVGSPTKTCARTPVSKNLPSRTFLFYDGHPGYDYSVACGTNVYAVTSGTVRYPNAIPGLTDARTFHVLELDPDSPNDGYKIYYLHLSTYFLNLPTSCKSAPPLIPRNCGGKPCHVSAGQLIGRTGDAGVPGSPHLHFEIQLKSGVPVDPYGWKGVPGKDPYTRSTNKNLWR